ncbi:putative ABC protein, subfamily ABCG [Daphnia magna]|uniref:Putative ABC protein, subfamily ABCG n=1 Tax=Daphnia magna TaxID=35525 RepID=A0A164LEU4_9CRUS|nr:putative ABC protein, subfamily ABCG [Daphnia magna]
MDTDIKLRERNRGTTATRENQEVSSFDLTFSDLSYTVGKGWEQLSGGRS